MGGSRIRLARLAVAAVASAVAAACLDSPPDDGADDDALQLLENPDFEDGISGWDFMGAVQVASAEELGFPASPEDGGQLALLGGDDGATDLMSQVLVVPEWVGRLEISGHRCFVTSEPFDMPWDYFTITIEPAAGGDREVVVRDSNLQASATACDWEDFRVVTDAHAGEEIKLTIKGTTDCAAPTSFAVDGLALTATR